MLMHPEKFSPLVTDLGFQGLVATGYHRNFSFCDTSTDELYHNFFHNRDVFFRVTKIDALDSRQTLEAVEDRTLVKKLTDARGRYLELYFC